MNSFLISLLAVGMATNGCPTDLVPKNFYYEDGMSYYSQDYEEDINTAETYSSEPIYVTTPNGTKVIVSKGLELKQSQINKLNKECDELVPTATRIADASAKYNCHSYAWYMQSTSNPYLMEDPRAYYLDGSYVQVDEPMVGDRICYFASTGGNVHSGIVTDVASGESNGICGDADLVTVVSKWGKGGLYEHKGDECPYTMPYGGYAVKVRYYHRHNFAHHYDTENTLHKAYCVCGASIEEEHEYTDHYTERTGSTHNSYCACGEYIVEEHEFEAYFDPNWDGISHPKREKQCKQCLYRKIIKDWGSGNNLLKKEEEYEES